MVELRRSQQELHENITLNGVHTHTHSSVAASMVLVLLLVAATCSAVCRLYMQVNANGRTIQRNTHHRQQRQQRFIWCCTTSLCLMVWAYKPQAKLLLYYTQPEQNEVDRQSDSLTHTYTHSLTVSRCIALVGWRSRLIRPHGELVSVHFIIYFWKNRSFVRCTCAMYRCRADEDGLIHFFFFYIIHNFLLLFRFCLCHACAMCIIESRKLRLAVCVCVCVLRRCVQISIISQLTQIALTRMSSANSEQRTRRRNGRMNETKRRRNKKSLPAFSVYTFSVAIHTIVRTCLIECECELICSNKNGRRRRTTFDSGYLALTNSLAIDK